MTTQSKTQESDHKPTLDSLPIDRGVNLQARQRALSSMREEFLETLQAILGYTQMLADDALERERPADFLADIAKLHDSTTGTYEFVKAELVLTWPELGTPQFPERWRKVRHDIGNQLNPLLGFCQFLLQDEEEQFFGGLAGDLRVIQQSCRACEATLARYKDFDADTDAQDRDSTVDAAPQRTKDFVAARQRPIEPAMVLVADDNANSRDLLARFLQREGHEVSTAADGRQALDILQHEEFDLVLLDFLMPELNGFQVLQQVKSDERLRHTPVIVVSGLEDMDEMVPCIELGAEDFLNKPVDLSMLKARVNACLEKKWLRERELGQFFTPELARYIVRHPELLTEGRNAEITVLFCDIRGFSRISERLGPSDTVRWLSDVMGVLSDSVMNHRGVLVDYIGDELMAMWGAPEEQPEHAELACRAALDMLEQLPKLSDRWRDLIKTETTVGIGLNTGVARVGNTGSHRRLKFGPLGDTVNLASRVQGATKYLGSRLLVTDTTHTQLSQDILARRLCQVRVVNIERPIELYEVFSHQQPHGQEVKQRYEEALRFFEQQEFRAAAAILGNMMVDYPHDVPSLLLMSRVVDMLLHAPEPGEFDQVWELAGK